MSLQFTCIPAIHPLIRRAIALAEIAAGAGETNIGGFVPAALFEGDDMIDGEAGTVMLAVCAKAALSETHVGEFLGCE